MDQYVNISLFIWPGLVLLIVGALLYRAKNGVLASIGAILVLTGVYVMLLSIRPLDPTLAFAIVMVLTIAVGYGMTRSKGGSRVVGVLLMVFGILALIPTFSTLMPNFDGGQVIRDALSSVADFLRQLFGAADQGLGNLNQ